jgi:hypothetical protein
MAAAAVTPRVRTIVICDEVTPSSIEAGVFTLEGVRQHVEATALPWRGSLSVFLLLASPRKGRYEGKVLVVNERTDRTVRYVKFTAPFEHDNELIALAVEMEDCLVPETGAYTFEVYLSAPTGEEALKGEHPFIVSTREE